MNTWNASGAEVPFAVAAGIEWRRAGPASCGSAGAAMSGTVNGGGWWCMGIAKGGTVEQCQGMMHQMEQSPRPRVVEAPQAALWVLNQRQQ